MKKIIILIIVIITTALVTGCGQVVQPNMTKEAVSSKMQSIDVFLDESDGDGRSTFQFVSDKETGCQYIFVDGYKSVTITPRMNADGTQKCN